MKTGDIVFQNYSGIHRYGKVIEVKENLKGDGWCWFSINWIDDEKYTDAQKWKAQMRGLSDNEYLPKYYRADDIQLIDLNKTLRTIVKLKERS